ncbi:MFS transporter [Iodobacter fluviatilis]|uniref:Multidrug transporter MdfA n=1 Tax=Iodobacter fluviatilis TaxID=537 RepID=A0A7G3GE96_9NEIS|nr:MFS transporter [Iodobacter fluviatilis]QBC45243.1 multidrug transporter MdfA [Iodobacter fluviatilis]
MPANTLITQLTWRTMLLPLALVLFEFSTYIANDMILPGMLAVTREFNAGPQWVPTSMTAYLVGGASLQWLLGPLSDRIGRRPVMLYGVAFFITTCLLTLFTHSIEQFIVLRVFQGVGMCFIGAVGYALVQESFDEKTAIKVTALMANVAMIAPLLGPLAGAIMMELAPWRMIFVLIAAVAFVSFIGLWHALPRIVPNKNLSPFTYRAVWQDYKNVFSNTHFLTGALAMGLCSVPLLTWIGISPVILIGDAGLSPIEFGYWQIPVFAALIIGNFTLAKLSNHLPVRRMIGLGLIPQVFGLSFCFIAMLFAPSHYIYLVIGISFYAFGCGLVNAGLFRLVLFSSDVSKGTVAAAFGMITMGVYSLGIEGVKAGHLLAGNRFFASALLIVGGVFIFALKKFMDKHQRISNATIS